MGLKIGNTRENYDIYFIAINPIFTLDFNRVWSENLTKF